MFRGVPWDEMGLPTQNSTSTNHEAMGLITLGFDPHSSNNEDAHAHDGYHTNDRLVPSRHNQIHLPTSWPDMFSPPTLPRFIPQSMSPITSPLRGHSWNDRWWQTANQSYEMIVNVGPYSSDAASLISASTLFKAIASGWSTLSLRDQNNPVFMILREIDEKVFFHHSRVSRIALAIKSHRLLKYYLCADRANLAELSDWQRPRPSQRAYKHPIAIDFFAWPGLRDKMVRNHAQYFQNQDFSEAYRQHFKFMWPFSFEDTYQYDQKNDTYVPTALFEKYHRDLKNWRFEESFFKKYPELVEAVGYVDPDPTPAAVEVEAPAITRARNSTAMMAATEDFPEVTGDMGQGVDRAMMEAEAQNPQFGERRSVHEPLESSAARRNMSMAEQVGVEGLADLWMTT